MHNKKIKSGVAVTALAAVLIGGTFAWFNASDSVSNRFTTASGNGGDHNNKIRIYELFDTENAGKVVAGTAVNKDAQVRNLANYDSIIRVKFTPQFVTYGEGESGQETVTIREDLDASNINYTLTNIGKEQDGELNGKWFQDGEWYYYVGNVAPEGFTEQILDSVTLDESVKSDPDYREANFEVKIEAQSVQSSVDAIIDPSDGGFGLVEGSVLANALKAVVQEAPGTATQIPNSVQVND